MLSNNLNKRLEWSEANNMERNPFLFQTPNRNATRKLNAPRNKKNKRIDITNRYTPLELQDMISKPQRNRLKNISEFVKNRESRITLKNHIIEKQKAANVKNEYDRLRNELALKIPAIQLNAVKSTTDRMNELKRLGREMGLDVDK